MPPDYEAVVQRVYEAVLDRGDLALDVGAHLGRHTFPMAASVGPAGRVLAFEPLDDCRRQLLAELRADSAGSAQRTAVYGWALGRERGHAEFVVALDFPAYSGLRERVYDAPTRIQKRHVRLETIDRMFVPFSRGWIWSRRRRLRFIKIDAEGGEYHILLGAKRTICRNRPVIAFEFGANSIGEYGFEPRELSRYLASVGYSVVDILGRDVSDENVFASSAGLQKV